MGFLYVKPGSQKGHGIKMVFFLMVLIILAFLSNGSAKESTKIQIVSQGITSHSQDSRAKSEEHQIITIDLPDLPKDAKKLHMVLIKPGSFVMGSSTEELGRSEFAWPLHQVTITKSFYIGRYEVTQAQWEAVMGVKSHRSKFRGKPNNPVEKVSWLACQKFIKRLNALGQGSFRLPTEAEWEYACRAGTNTLFSFGDSLEIADEYMWWRENNHLNGTRQVGLKKPNPWGLYDMHGNVSEWCSDLWEKPYKRGSQTDPEGPSPNWFSRIWPLSNHVNRGGSVYHGFGAPECGSAARHYEQAIDFHYSLGFRLVREYP
jgi:formylglycine-generating enzyme required for sulfatase activity